MLETIREFGLEQLAAAGETAAVEHAHAAFYLALVEQAEPALDAAEQAAWLDRLETDHGNLRVALSVLAQTGGAPLLRFATALTVFWNIRSQLTEGNAWLERALAQRADAPGWLQRKALRAASMLAWAIGDYPRSRQRAQEALTAALAVGDAAGIAEARYHLGTVAELEGDDDQAEPLYAQALQQWRDLGDAAGIANAAMVLGDTAYRRGESARADALAQEALAIYRKLGDHAAGALTLGVLGEVALTRGDVVGAITAYSEALVLAQAVGDWSTIADALSGFAGVALAAGQPKRAARLLGAVDALCGAAGRFQVAHHLQHKRALAAARNRLDPATFAAAWAAGRADPLAHAIAAAQALAADSTGGNAAGTPSTAAPGGLTPREREVLRLLVVGATNRDIAAALFISHRTAMTHVTHILAKLDVATRTEAAAWAVRHGLA
jgi:DNA-binding CsgD family transcriptional regulator/tetratricopeptide (TPR) repeat protein